VDRSDLLEGNSKLALSSSIAEIAGPGLTGVLVQLITAPIAILFDALSFVFSAVSVWLIRKPEPILEAARAQHWKQETAAGLRFVFAHQLLRPLACFSMTAFFSFGFLGPLYVLFALRELRVPPAALGAVIAVVAGRESGVEDRKPLRLRADTGWFHRDPGVCKCLDSARARFDHDGIVVLDRAAARGR
jgi:hypothetical protein